MRLEENIKNEKTVLDIIGKFLNEIAYIFEVVFVFVIWFFIFSNAKILGGFEIKDMVAYLIVGNLIGFFSSYLLHRTVRSNIGEGDHKMFHYKPLLYIVRVFSRSLKKMIIPFSLSIILNLVLMYFFVNSVYLNGDPRYLALIIIMMILAFFIELLTAFIFDMYVFWAVKESLLSKIIARLKKIFAGAYFPLDFLGLAFMSISLFFPFAYSFYIPTQLYLKKIPLSVGLIGLSVQIFWIVFLYFIIKLSWNRKIDQNKKLLDRKAILE